ncbi:GNAT family N-acetyltransferase [Aestuariibacter halophilus]|uniref:GNAT family N-acetyltransferase n=1 Tax=Fluctibacter halophilus TaxID=226011 RepID=A0ABS8G9F7_9ALTE|nr:GNAT family N-acetyltransferase [Aestuariibacter halophilus]MCC2617219.1 GNAT family N-acetyltransferase [Aestuariibacter halophilus]
MKIDVLQNPDLELIEFLSDKLTEFNWQRWEVSERLPLAVQATDDDGNVLAGASGRTFGDWLLLDRLWVSDELRGQHIGSQLLEQMELAAKQRGCTKCLLDTLNFQAKPFYEKHGYTVQWVQEGYPRDGCKYFMTKDL